MELQGERLIPAPVENTWAALNDPDFLKSCIANCETLERTDPDTLAAVVAMKVGPVSARFKGKLTITNVQAPNSYTINFEGQGGVAGFGKGSADVSLLPAAEGQTTLSYAAKATVGGKIAQIGSRLIDSAAGKITNDFFTAFVTQMEARNSALVGGATTGSGNASGAGGPGDGAGAGSELGGASSTAVGSATAHAGGSATPPALAGTPGTSSHRVADPVATTAAPVVTVVTSATPATAGAAASNAGGAPDRPSTAALATVSASSSGTLSLDPAVTKTWALIGALVAVGAIYFAIR